MEQTYNSIIPIYFLPCPVLATPPVLSTQPGRRGSESCRSRPSTHLLIGRWFLCTRVEFRRHFVKLLCAQYENRDKFLRQLLFEIVRNSITIAVFEGMQNGRI